MKNSESSHISRAGVAAPLVECSSNPNKLMLKNALKKPSTVDNSYLDTDTSVPTYPLYDG